jgi:RsiW-degrading membrane proteinase PrsW (M82 family)
MPDSSATLATWVLCLGLGLLPVLTFLLALVLLDSYKLIRLRRVLTLVVTGAAIGLICLFLNPWLIETLSIDQALYTRTLGPFVEELLKGSVIALALYRRRIGFLVDAAVWGFAIGAGFAAFENSHYFALLGKPSPMLWVIRGFGTAIMHGGATSLMSVLSKQLVARFDSVLPPIILPGLLLATLVHSSFNHFYLSPSLSTLLLLVVLPLLFVIVFRASEQATHSWLGTGFDSDQELLEVVNDGRVSEIELSVRAKGVLMMQKAGFTPPADPEVKKRLLELTRLEENVGTTGLIALHPIFSMSHHDLWQLHMLRED